MTRARAGTGSSEEARKVVEAHARCGITDMRMEIRPIFGPEDFTKLCGSEAAAEG